MLLILKKNIGTVPRNKPIVVKPKARPGVFFNSDTKISKIENGQIKEASIYDLKKNDLVLANNNNKLTKLEKALLLLTLDNKEEIEKIGGKDNMLKEVGNTIIDYSTEEAKYAELREIELNEDLCFMEGEAKGKKYGLKEGEKKKQLEIAKNMKKKGIDLETISECVNMPLKQLQKISIK